MAAPRTVAGQAAISALRPHLRRALAPTILAIEEQAAAPYVAALREADRVLADVAGRDPGVAWEAAARMDLVMRARATRALLEGLLAPVDESEPR
jgi:hypothetical protein